MSEMARAGPARRPPAARSSRPGSLMPARRRRLPAIRGPARTPGECRGAGAPSDRPATDPAGNCRPLKERFKCVLARELSQQIRLASHHALPEITAHMRFVSLSPGRGRGRPGDAARFRPRRSRPGGRTAGTEVARTPGPGPGGPGTMPPPASQPELNCFYQPPKTEVSRDRCV
jgi:hypothetical protein